MEASQLDGINVDVAGRLIEISMHERDELLERLRIVAGGEAVVSKFEVAWASRLVELDEDDCGRLRIALVLWKAVVFDDLPDGIAHLLAELEQADSSDGGGASRNE